MAQIALCKTVQESQATNPDVAKVLTNKVYMDRIFVATSLRRREIATMSSNV